MNIGFLIIPIDEVIFFSWVAQPATSHLSITNDIFLVFRSWMMWAKPQIIQLLHFFWVSKPMIFFLFPHFDYPPYIYIHLYLYLHMYIYIYISICTYIYIYILHSAKDQTCLDLDRDLEPEINSRVTGDNPWNAGFLKCGGPKHAEKAVKLDDLGVPQF